MRKKIYFTGSFGEYFVISLGLLALTVLTIGIAFPYWVYWSFQYFFSKLQLDGKQIYFAGSFGEYFITSLLLLILSVITLGILFPYWMYWSTKYFFTRMEIQS